MYGILRNGTKLPCYANGEIKSHFDGMVKGFHACNEEFSVGD